MEFIDVLKNIEELIDLELKSINPSTPSIYLRKIDYVSRKYYIANSLDIQGRGRSFNELNLIWNELQRKGFCNVDQALYGGNSSRNQPETIFSNLPFIQHFKYNSKKHIILRKISTHPPGTLDELISEQFMLVKKQVDNFLNLSIHNIVYEQKSILESLNKTYNSIIKKHPSEYSVIKNEVIDRIDELNKKLSRSLVTLDCSEHEGIIPSEKKYIIPHENIEDKIDSENYTGIEEDIEDKQITLDLAGEFLDKSDDLLLPKGTKNISHRTPVLSLIYDRVCFNEIELQPDFQRKDRIWSDEKKIKLIESILMNLPLPVFYFAEKTNGDWIVVDGLQRITSIYDFIRGIFPLNKLSVMGEDYDNKFFNDLTRREQRHIREYSITAHIIEVTPKNSGMIVELFHRINTYGVKLSGQEIRSALNQGTSVKFLRYLASLEIFKKSTHGKVNPDRQKDMELCLSALSFIISGYNSFGQESYDSFLSKAMAEMNRHSLKLLNSNEIDSGLAYLDETSSQFYLDLDNRFIRGLTLANKIFGEFSFIKEPAERKSPPISKPLFELIVSYFSATTLEQEDIIIKNSPLLIEMLYNAIANDSTDFAIWDSKTYQDSNRGFKYSISTSTGKKATVKYRFEAFKEILLLSTGIDIKITQN